MKKILITILFLCHLIQAEEKILIADAFAAYGKGKHYRYDYKYWNNSTNDEKLLSVIVDEDIQYEYSYHGVQSFKVTEVKGGKRTPLVTFDEYIGGSYLVGVKVIDKKYLYVLITQSLGYRLCRFIKKDDTWEKEMQAIIFTFLDLNHDASGVKKAYLTNNGGCLSRMLKN